MMKPYDYLIVGSGVIGMTIAATLRERFPDAEILVIDKEDQPGRHASGRNSGVLHAGFYYARDSLKARFCAAGNKAWKAFAAQNGIRILECGKLVVAADEEQRRLLHELYDRGRANGVRLEIINEHKAREIEPLAVTHKQALWSPDTASIDPHQACAVLHQRLNDEGVRFLFQTEYRSAHADTAITTRGEFRFRYLINAAGLYADRIAEDFGLAGPYVLLPFRGDYWIYEEEGFRLHCHIYPVPDPRFPFLGVHWTLTADGRIKIGPTARVALWREQYGGWARCRLGETAEIIKHMSLMTLHHPVAMTQLGWKESLKMIKRQMIREAQRLIPTAKPTGFVAKSPPGIRAQLIDTRHHRFVNDFIITQDARSLHVLNAVSPAFTCAWPFAAYVVERVPKVR